MKKLIIALLAAAAIAPACEAAAAEPDKAAVLAAINAYQPGVTGFGAVKVDSIDVNTRRRTATVYCNTAASYLPLTQERAEALMADVARAMGDDFANYRVDVRSDGHSLGELALFASKADRKSVV